MGPLIVVLLVFATIPTTFLVQAVSTDFTIVDLGTLGGQESVALDINNRGQIVGWSHTSSGVRHPFLWERGRMEDLGTLPGAYSGEARAINDNGVIVGYNSFPCVPHEPPFSLICPLRPFLWKNGVMTDLGTLTEFGASAGDINNRGQVVGASIIAVPGCLSSTPPPGCPNTSSRIFLWEEGVMTDIGTLPGYSLAWEPTINERGQIIGTNVAAELNAFRAFLWENGVLRDLGTLGGPDSEANDINNHGQVVGGSTTSSGEHHAVLWDKTSDGGDGDIGMVDLGTLPGHSRSGALDISEQGEIVGSSATASGEQHPVLWRNGMIIDLGAFEGRTGHMAQKINERGQIIGSSLPFPARIRQGFFWEKGVIMDLGSLPGRIGSQAFNINDLGHIVGFSRLRVEDPQIGRSSLDRAIMWRTPDISGH